MRGQFPAVFLFILLAPVLAASSTEMPCPDLVYEELDHFMNGLMQQQLVSYEIPGAAVSVVKDGKLIFSAGYGYADIEGRIPVTPDSTLFRIGSVSKLFVWTAVMQLVELGELDLHTDVNDYLESFSIPDTFDEPITLAHLLTHTPGFEEQILGVFVPDSSMIDPLGAYLAGYIPARVRPPGTLSSYSNYGTALAAYIVQEVSGVPFAEYVERNIYEPLGMEISSFRQPPPGNADLVATGYVNAAGRQLPREFEWVQAYPAGSMSATADEMAAFMTAHLQNGIYRGNRILADSTAIDMHHRHFAHDPRVNGWTWGFMELVADGERIIWHGGDTYYCHSAMYLMPDHDLGIFVAYNSPAGAKARIDLLKAFMNEYMFLPPPETPEPLEDPGHAEECSGSYLDIRSNCSTPEKLLTLLNPQRVETAGEHTVVFAGNTWIEVEPLVFRNVSRAELLVFRENSEGQVEAMFRGNNPTTAYLRLSWLSSPDFQKGLAVALLVTFASVILLWPLGFIAWLLGKKKGTTVTALLGGLLVWINSCVYVFFLIRLNAMVTGEGFDFGVPEGMNSLLALPYFTLLMTVLMAALAVVAWRRGLWPTAGRIHFTLVAIAGVIMTWWMSHWNLLFYHFG